MLTRFSDYGGAFAVMDELRRRMDQLLTDHMDWARGGWPDRPDGAWSLSSGGWPRINVYDAGPNLVVEAEVPGLSQEDLQLTINQNVLSLSGERRSDVPEGYTVHRQERAPVRFSQSFALPSRVDPEKTSASLENGVLVVSVAKAAEEQPRKISIRA